jgi:pyruvate,water dikinase
MALPSLAIDLIDRVDEDLAKVPPPSQLSDEKLDALLENSFQMLVALHGYEVLVGALTSPDEAATSAGAIALRALAEGRMEGLDDAAIVHKLPWVLALVPPSVASWTLPGADSVLRLPEAQGDETPSLRENLRMRVRWVQELTARASREIGTRLEQRGVLNDAREIAEIGLGSIRAALLHGTSIELCPAVPRDSAPLPAAFRFSADGSPIAEASSAASVGAGGGRVVGTVRGLGNEDGDVLVVRTLDPDLAPSLVGARALVAETGSPLSHLAILAREMGIATVVSVEGATSRFLPGQRIVVDGMTGEVELPIDPIQVIA